MSISQRISKITKAKLNELQAKIVLLKKKKYSLTELLDIIVSFSLLNEDKFLNFLSAEQQNDELNIQKEKFIQFILSPIEGACPEDYKEYDFEDLREE
ncbi:MAG: hypothetical protein ACTSO9_03605 [Candidatus Helarchaeota archaeon]